MPIFVDGTEIQELFVDGSPADELFVDGVQVFPAPPGSQEFLASGNFTVPAGIREVVICMCGGGGAGGNVVILGAGGGGGSGIVRQSVTVTPGEVIPVIVAIAQNLSKEILPTTQAESSFFNALSGAVEAEGGFSGAGDNAIAGLGVNGGGNGGNGNAFPGFDTTATCDGSTNTGGVIGGSPIAGGGGAGAYGNGGNAYTDAPVNSGAGAGGITFVTPSRAVGGSGRCIVYWGGTEP